MLGALALLGVLSVFAVVPPAPLGVDAPADRFSASRAFTHVQRIGLREHPAGSAAAAQVRDYIAATLDDLGLDARIREGIGATGELSGPFGMADTRNVVARLPGSASTGTLILMAHYDSVQVSHGGNDDGAGVSTLLEVARALTSGPPPTNDVVFLFTDAEEACLCGAESFVAGDPLAAGRAVVLNIESRGSTGPSVMFETSPGNADLVSLYGSAVPQPVATSLAVEVYRILPNNTDFTPFMDAGRFTGLNSAYIDGSGVYHAPQDTPQSMDLASLQHEGDNALALTSALSVADLAALAVPAAGDATYFPALGLLIRYPGWWAWPLAVAALAAVGLAGWLAVRRGACGWLRLLGGLCLALIPLVLAPLMAQAFWALLVAIRPGYANLLDPWWPGWFRAAVVAVVAFVVLLWLGLLRRRIGPWPLTIGALGLLALLGVVMAALMPGGSYLAALPALAGGLATMATLVRPVLWVRAVAGGLAGAVAVIVLVPTVFLFFPALGLATGAGAALFAVLLGLALLPVLDLLYPDPADPSRHRLWSAAPALAAALAVVTFTGIGLRIDHFDQDHPAPAELAYILDTDSRAGCSTAGSGTTPRRTGRGWCRRRSARPAARGRGGGPAPHGRSVAATADGTARGRVGSYRDSLVQGRADGSSPADVTRRCHPADVTRPMSPGRCPGRCRCQPADEDAERMAGRVGEDEQRLVGIGRPVQQLPRAQGQRPVPVPEQFPGGGHDGVQVQHLRPRPVRPGRRRVVGDLLERQRARTVGVPQDQPIPVRCSVVAGRRLVARTVAQAEQSPVELGEAARVRAVQHGLQDPRMAGGPAHRPDPIARIRPRHRTRPGHSKMPA